MIQGTYLSAKEKGQRLVEVFSSLPAGNITTLRIENYKPERLKEGVNPNLIVYTLSSVGSIQN